MVDDARSWLILARAPGLGAAQLRKLLRRYATPASLIAAGGNALRSAGLHDATITALQNPDESLLESDLRWLDAADHYLLHQGDELYPAALTQTPYAPAWLFAAGRPEILSEPQLAVVGSRNPTPAGEETACAFAAHLAGVGLTVTSGLARGIDAAAHRGALTAGGNTVAVCATGLDCVYPRSNTGLAGQIRASGVLVSEFPPGTEARKAHFPQRNRIIAGLSMGTLVVEAAHRSGALITAHRAVEAGREVFAIPGSIHNPLSRGCHRLLREGARLVESVNDILAELGPELRALLAQDDAPPVRPSPGPGLSREYANLLQQVGFEPTSIDTLVQRSGLTAHEVSSMLLLLELQDFIKPSPSGGYTRTTMRSTG